MRLPLLSKAQVVLSGVSCRECTLLSISRLARGYWTLQVPGAHHRTIILKHMEQRLLREARPQKTENESFLGAAHCRVLCWLSVGGHILPVSADRDAFLVCKCCSNQKFMGLSSIDGLTVWLSNGPMRHLSSLFASFFFG